MKKNADAFRFIIFIILSCALYWWLLKLSFPSSLMYENNFFDAFWPNATAVFYLLFRLFIGAIVFGAAAVIVGKLNPSNQYSRVAALILLGITVAIGIREIWNVMRVNRLAGNMYFIHKGLIFAFFLIVAAMVNARLNRGKFA
jgi:hypothetical protein